jgi:hypothetical protein
MEDGLDLAAAALRGDEKEVDTLVAVLAAKLAAALPGRCAVDRRGRKVRRLTVDLGGRRFVLRRERREVVAEIETTVHDMRRRTDRVPVDAWLAALRTELERQADESAEARAALERLAP